MKHKTNFKIVLAGVIFVLAVASFSLVAYKTYQTPTVLGESTEAPMEKVVQNTQYGFSYVYPSNLYVNQETNAVTWLYSPSPFDFIASPKTTDGTAISGIQVQVYDNTKNLALADWMTEQPKFPTFTTTQKTLPSGVVAFVAETTSEDWHARNSYFVPLHQAILQISFYANNDVRATQDYPVFEKLVNSLQVSLQNQGVSQETYQNGTVGFLIDYPSNMQLEGESYDEGRISFLNNDKKLEVHVAFGGEPAAYKTLQEYFEKQEALKEVSKPIETKVAGFSALVSTLSRESDNSYYFIQTSNGYYTIHVKKAKDITSELKVVASNIINSFRVYELVSTQGWQNYVSSDAKIRLQYPADASIENLTNGVQIQAGAIKIGIYSYQNLGLNILDWIDNAQLNKYKGADSRHLALQVKSTIDEKDALRTVDPVTNLRLATYIQTKDVMYIAEMNPFNVKDTKNLALYNTILKTLDVK